MSGSEGPDGDAGVGRERAGWHVVAGERGIVAVHKLRSVASRIGDFTALAVVGLIAAALLVAYYHAALERPGRRERNAVDLARREARSGMVLPPLGHLQARAHRSRSAAPPVPGARSLRLKPVHPPQRILSRAPSRRLYRVRTSGARSLTRHDLSPAVRALQRRLSGPVWATGTGALRAGASTGGAGQVLRAAKRSTSPASSLPVGAPARGRLASRLVPTATPVAVARMLPSPSLVLPKGSVIDCTLETAIDSTLPGLTTCVTATDTFGANGKVVLLERGSQLVGETRGVVEQGRARVFVLWTQARTPNGVVISLASPGTDALGRAGLAGRVNRHFWQRFGAALLISVVNAGVQAGVQSGRGALIYDPTASQNVATEVLRHTLRIAPQVSVEPGARVEVLVARDLDFRSVYALRLEPSRRSHAASRR